MLNPSISNIAPASFSFPSQFSASRPDLVGVGASSNPSPQTPIHSSPNSQYSEFASSHGLNAINLNNDEIKNQRQDGVPHWQWEEDEMLISAWLNISTDLVVGTDQKGDTFWNQIYTYCEQFNPTMKIGSAACKKRWHKINKAVAQGGIYPEWVTFVKSISKPQGENRKLFAQYQEGQQKDVERAFGVLQERFAIIRGPARFWEKKKLANIMRACIILHNMIVEDGRDTYAGSFAQGHEYDDVENVFSQPQLGEESFASYHQFLQRNAEVHNRQKHRQLKEDLIEHIWQFHNARR